MSKTESLFGKWLIERGITLDGYADMSREQKVRLQDEYDAYDWRTKSQAAVAEAAKVPSDFFVWALAQHDISREEFDTLPASKQMRLADAHSYALANAKKAVETASQKPVSLPKDWDAMSPRAQLDYLNKRDLIEKGYIRE